MQADIERIYMTMLQFVAGGSEYTGVDGIKRGIRELGEQRNKYHKMVVNMTIAENQEIVSLRETISAILNCL